MAKGDHLYVPLCGLFSHHGIDIGDGTVVHWWSGDNGSKHPLNKVTRKANAQIRRSSLEDFCDGQWSSICVRGYQQCFEAEIVVQRALSRVGEKGYHLLWNNCEHFATWCKTGCQHSEQVHGAQRQLTTTVAKTAACATVKVLAKNSSKIGVKSAARVATPWLLVADGVQLVTELAATTHGGMDPEEARQTGQAAGLAASVAIGTAVGGPAGALVAGGIWFLGELIGELFS